MKILLIDVNYKNSSTGRIMYELYNYINSVPDCEAAVCYGRGKKSKDKNAFKFGIDIETLIHSLLTRLTGYTGCFSYFSTKKLIKFIKKYKPDVVHLHELHAYFVNIKPLINYLKKNNIPVVWTFHCEFMYTGKCGYSYNCTSFQKECGKCPAVKEYPKSLFFDKTKRMLATKKQLLNDLDFIVVTPSEWLADRVRLSFLKNKRIEVIHNGVDTDIFHPKATDEIRNELGISPQKNIALFVAPQIMSERKGGKWVIKLAEVMKNEEIIFVMVGDGVSEDKKYNNIIFTGPVYDLQKLSQLYSMADVFLLCSEKETYSMTCAEAMCCGTPVVGFECGAPETVFNGPYAEFVEYGNVDQMYLAVKKFIGKKGECKEEYYKKFGLEHMNKKYKELYDVAFNSKK